MDRDRIVQVLGLIDGGTFFVTDVLISQWGGGLTLVCDYQSVQPDGTPDALVVFRLVFRDCREIRLKSYAHIAVSEMGMLPLRTELRDVNVGLPLHRRDANLLSAHFSVTITYGELVIETDTHTYPIT